MRRYSWFVVSLVTALMIFSGMACSRDPNVQKKKYFDSGNQYFAKGEYREAAIQFANAVQIDPAYTDAHYRLAETYMHMADYQRSYTELRRTVDLQPDNLKAQIELGNLLLAAGKLDDAQKKAEFVLGKDPNNADAHSLAANIAAAEKKPDVAKAEMLKAIELDPKRWQFYHNLALLQANMKDYSSAEASLKHALELSSKTATPYLSLATLYEQQQRWDDAEKALRSGIEAERDNPVARAALAKFLVVRQRKPEAEQVAMQAKRDLANNPQGYVMLADYYAGTGEVDKAIAEYGRLRDQHPDDRRVIRNYVGLLILRNRLDEADGVVEGLLKKNAKDTDALIFKGDIQNRRKDPGAVATLQAALKIVPDSAAAHYQLGLAYMREGKLDQAESEMRSAIKLKPTAMDARAALARLVTRKGDFTELQQIGNDFISIQPRAAEGYLIRASGEMGRSDFKSAESDVSKAIQLAPNNATPYLRLGGLRLLQKRPADAEKAFLDAMHHDPSSNEALQALVALYVRTDRADKALALVNPRLEKEPNNSVVNYLKGICLVATKNLAGAEQAMQRAVDLDKSNVTAVLALGQLQISLGNVDQAIASYERRISDNPKDVRFLFLVGSLEEGRGNDAKAEQMYQKALAVDPNYAPAANNLAYLMIKESKNIDVAISLAQVARQGMPDLPNTADTLGWAYYNKALYGLAVDTLRDAVSKAPQNATYHYHLGLAYEKNHDAANAKLNLEKALQLDPKYAQADEIRRVLKSLGT